MCFLDSCALFRQSILRNQCSRNHTLEKKITEWDGHVFRLPYQGTEKEDLGQGESHSVLVTRRMYWRGRADNLLLQVSHTTWVAGEGIRMEGAWVCDPEGLTELSTSPLSS